MTTLKELEQRVEALEKGSAVDNVSITQVIPERTIVWGKSSDKEMTWQEAKDWCKEQGGRLPTRIELQLAYEYKVEGFKSSYYWSATESDATLAWLVNFDGGSTNSYYKYDTLYVRCVTGW
jgi:hypothetical protein